MTTPETVDLSRLDAETLARQLALPEGPVGRAVIDRLNRSNASSYDAIVPRLGLFPGCRILEVGFGNGCEISRILGVETGVRYTGLDLSPTMVAAASEINAAHLQAGRVALHHGSSSAMPFDDLGFDRVLVVNTIYFWAEPIADLTEIKRVLQKGGRLVLGALAPWSAAGRAVFQHGFRFYAPGEMETLLRGAGFESVTVETVNETVEMANGPWNRDYFFVTGT